MCLMLAKHVFPVRGRNKDLEVFVDNAGAVAIYKKGYSSSCLYSYTVALATNEVAKALNVMLLWFSAMMRLKLGGKMRRPMPSSTNQCWCTLM